MSHVVARVSHNQAVPTRVRCGECKRVLDEPPDLAPADRHPCPHCGNTARTFEVEATATVRATASLAWEKTHEEIERHWPWLLASLVLTIVGSLVGLLVGGLLGLVLGLALGLLSFPVGLRSATLVREIERGRDR